MGSGPLYTQWDIVRLSNRDCFEITGHGPGGQWGPLLLDALLVASLKLDESHLMIYCRQAAQMGMSPQDFGDMLLDKQAKVARAMQQAPPNPYLSGIQQFQPTQQQMSQMAQQQQAYMQGLGQGFGGPPQMSPQQLAAMGQQQLNQLNQNLQAPMNPVARGAAREEGPLWEKPERLEQEIIAYRGWLLDWELVPGQPCGPDDPVQIRPVLHSINQKCVWPGPVLRADPPPREHTHAGIYAVGVDGRFQHNFDQFVAVGTVWGEVALSGIVVEGAAGYRAEVCTIRRLWVGGSTRINVYIEPFERLAQMLADRYQCDVGAVPVTPTLDQAHHFYQETKGERDAEATRAREEGAG